MVGSAHRRPFACMGPGIGGSTRKRLTGTSYRTFQAIAAPRTNSANSMSDELSVLSNIGLYPRFRLRGSSQNTHVFAEPPRCGKVRLRSVLAGLRAISSKLLHQLRHLLMLRLFHRAELSHELRDLRALRRGQVTKYVLRNFNLL